MDRELFDHFLRDDTRRGPAPDDAFTGAAGGAACGDLSRLSLTVAGGRIASVTFDTEGCGATRAATAALAETIEGATVLEAAELSIDDAEDLLGGLQPAKRHAAQLATDALHRALSAAAASNLPLDPATAGVGPDSPTLIASEGGRVRSPERVAVAVSGGVDSSRRGAPRTRARGGGRRHHREALGRSGDGRDQGLLLAGGRARGPRRRALAWTSRTSRSTSRRTSGVASSIGSSTATRKGRRRTPASSATGKCVWRRCSTWRSGSGRRGSSPGTTRGSWRTPKGRCLPQASTTPRTRATCSPRCRRTSSDSSASRSPT